MAGASSCRIAILKFALILVFLLVLTCVQQLLLGDTPAIGYGDLRYDATAYGSKLRCSFYRITHIARVIVCNSPTTHGGRLFCSFFALAGVAVLAIGLGVVGSKIIESQVAHIAKAEEVLTKDVFRLFRPTKPKTAQEKQSSYFEHSEGSSGGSGSFAYLDDFDNPNSELEDAVHPWHNVVDSCRFFGKTLVQYLPSLSPLFLGAYFIGHYEGWTWDDCI